jgi:hypothetical protein
MDFSKHLTKDERPYGTHWAYRFPNGHEASVVVDKRDAPFRFEILSTDPADNSNGHVVAGLTTEQAEAKLTRIAALPQAEVSL